MDLELARDRPAANTGEQLVATSKRALPQELLDGADHLRLLGNDAAHIEGKTYQSIGEPEVRIAIDLTKELLKSAYQY